MAFKLSFERERAFRFLDLPAELRNQIYEAALEPSRDHIVFLKPVTPWPPAPPQKFYLPYLSLTQVCEQIRTEFRPLWLSTHVVSLPDAHTYLSCFSPLNTTKLDGRYSMPEIHTLAITYKPDICWGVGSKTSILPLLLQVAQRPSLAITVSPRHTSFIGPNARSWVAPLTAFLNHRDELWLRRLKQGYFEDVYVKTYGFGDQSCFLCLRLEMSTENVILECSDGLKKAWLKEMGVLMPGTRVEWNSTVFCSYREFTA